MKRFITIAFTILSQVLSGQDATFTLIDNNPVSINPAFCIPAGNQFQAMTLFRQQWWNLPGPNSLSAAFQMNNGTFMIPILADRYSATGLSIQAFDNSSGEGDFSYSGVTTTIGQKFLQPLPNRAIVSMQVGVGFTFRNFSLDWSKLTFSSQLDPFFGYISSIPLVNPRVNSSPDFFTITPNAGVNFEYLAPNRNNKFTFGAGCFNLTGLGANSFFDNGNIAGIPRRFTGNFSYLHFTNGSRGLVEDLRSSYLILRHNFEYQASLMNNETRVGTNIAGALTVYSGYRRRLFEPLDLRQDAILFSLQINAPRYMLSIGYDYTISGLNIQRTRGTTELGLIFPLGTRGNLRGRAKMASEPCYVDYLLTHSEWKAVERFNNKSTDWGREYAPVIFIR